jgi:hypothetical protein
MGYVVQPSSGDVPEVPDSLYTATIKGVKPVKLDTPDQFGKSEKIEIKLEFEVDGEIVSLDPRVNPAWSEKATLFLIAIASGLDVTPHEAFDIDQLLNRQVNILTEQEEGKWPRVKAWSRVSTKKGLAPSQPVERPSTAVVNPDGSPNHDAFWRAINALGLTRKHVFDKAGGMDAFTAMDGADIGFLLEELKLQVEAAP